MRRALTENETVAVVLARMVADRCRATRTRAVSRTGLQIEVPVSERPAVRRGLDALLEHGVLVATGENIALTPAGQLLTTRADGNAARLSVEDEDEQASLRPMLARIDSDDRLSPHRDVEFSKTLPSRLENYQTQKTGSILTSPVLWIAAAAVIALLAWLLRR